MANVYFSNLEQLENYREERFGINMLDFKAGCPTLMAFLKPEEPGIYRYGKSVPMVRQGDTIIVNDGKTHYPRAFEKENEQIKEVITFDEIINSDFEILNHNGERQIIPPMRKRLRKDLFKKHSPVPNFLMRAIVSVATSIIVDELGKENAAEPSFELESCLTIGEYSMEQYREMAKNFLYEKQFKQGVRFAIGDDLINETIEGFKEEYQAVLEKIIQEVSSVFTSGFRDFLQERPCSRYHFQDNEIYFFVERGVDTRIYSMEKERFLKIEHEQEDASIFSTTSQSVQYSAKVDFF